MNCFSVCNVTIKVSICFLNSATSIVNKINLTQKGLLLYPLDLEQVGHHAQEDFGEEVGKVLKTLLKQASVV